MKDGFISWEDNSDSKAQAMEKYGKALESCTAVYKDSSRSTGNRRTFINIENNRSVRPDYDRSDYEAFREDSALPTGKRESIKMCMKAYKNIGIIRNIIDLMGDFACQGVHLVHRDKSVNSFYEQWAKKVNMKERSERFLNNLYRCGNVVAYRSNATMTPELIKFMRSVASDVVFKVDNPETNEIPLRYNFFNPLSLEVKTDGGVYLNVSNQSKLLNTNSFNSSFKTTVIPKNIFDTLPTKLRNDIENNPGSVKLEEDRLIMAHYKKDDWEQWADPLIHAILDDLMMLEKMRLSDLSALDGAISNIRLWTLGDLEHKILPTKEGIDRLRDILATNQGGGTMELVWGPELSFTESNTQVHKFLGSEKYNFTLSAIYAGMGVPPTLTGMAGNGGGFTNNFISLKTLVERLQYGRDLLIKFWEGEVELVRKAMGFRYSPEIRFDLISLSDEAAEKALLIQLADRDIISHETILERFKEAPKIEKMRLLREVADRKEEGTPDKAGPFHDANHPQNLEKMDKEQTFDMKKTKMQNEHDIEVVKLKPRPKPPGSGLKKVGKKTTKKPSAPNGRPKNSGDKTPRKQRIAKPRSKAGIAETIAWTETTWEEISKSISTAFLRTFEKNNLRQLTRAQTNELEELKIDILCTLEPMSKITNNKIFESLKGGYRAPLEFRNILKTKGISLEDMSVESYRKNVINLYVEYLVSYF